MKELIFYGTANKQFSIKIKTQQKILIPNSFKLKNYKSFVKVKDNLKICQKRCTFLSY